MPGQTDRVELRAADAFDLDAVSGDFDAVVAGFWLSHLDRAEIPGWLDALRRRLPGAVAVLFDNRYVEGSSTAISRTDPGGNTFQVRSLQSGEESEVRKNFFGRGELRDLFAPVAGELTVHASTYYWAARLTLVGESA